MEGNGRPREGGGPPAGRDARPTRLGAKDHRLETGATQGANIYLHYAFDLWAEQWRRTEARGEVIIVRYADDFVLGFQHKGDADRFLVALTERLRRFHLALHPDKTRLLEFGRFASENRQRRGQGKPETFDFLGFTHYCDRTRNGWFTVGRQTSAKRRRAKLAALKEVLHRRLHDSIGEVGAWLGSVVRGHNQYFGVPRNAAAMASFRFTVVKLWHKTLCRRSQRATVTWDRMRQIADRWLPPPRIVHPYPAQRLRLVSSCCMGRVLALARVVGSALPGRFVAGVVGLAL